jgi:CheY-like chemotaxis protein
VALFTAHAIELAQARAAGFRGLISKPFELDELLQQVRELLGR